MAVKLRLMRMGKTKQPTYRIVASDSRSPRNGRFIELLGTYEPRLEPSGLRIDAEKANKWIANGAQPTERVQKLLLIAGVLDEATAKKTAAAKKAAARPYIAPKSPKAVAAAEAAAQPAAESPAATDMKAAEEAAAEGVAPEGTPAEGDVAAPEADPVEDMLAATEANTEDAAK